MSALHPDTLCVQAGWEPANGQPRVLPICQSTTFKFDSGDDLCGLFDLTTEGHMYTRISNPTVECVERKIAALEGGVGAMCTSSGQAATLMSVLNICSAGQNILCLNTVYGGTFNLLDVTLRRLGVEARFISAEMSDAEIESFIDENTRAIWGETIANPALAVLDICRFASLAHRNGLPLIVDNTFATPILCRPFEHGADIVTHSTSKYMDGHATVLGGVVVDGGKFDWEAGGKYPELSTPDQSYHGVVYTRDFGPKAYITKARVQLMRDLGCTPQPLAAFLLNLGLDTLALRMERHSANALAVAAWLSEHPAVTWVKYPALPGDVDYQLCQRYLPQGACGVVSLGIAGGREAAMAFMNRLRLAKIVVHVADARTSVLHPASTTHRQMTDDQLIAAGVLPEQVRLSVGIERAEDIIADLNQALDSL